MRLNRGWIESRIPHRGTMCLLDEVIAWGAERVSCRTRTHRDPDNPLRARGVLGIACGVEYAAQAMAVHGALSSSAGSTLAAGPAPAAGFLAAVRDLRFHALRLDDVPGDLICDAVRMAGSSTGALYEFELRSDAGRLLAGRATVILDARAVPSSRPSR